jgi:hypothetical protein
MLRLSRRCILPVDAFVSIVLHLDFPLTLAFLRSEVPSVPAAAPPGVLARDLTVLLQTAAVIGHEVSLPLLHPSRFLLSVRQ